MVIKHSKCALKAHASKLRQSTKISPIVMQQWLGNFKGSVQIMTFH